MKKLFALLLSCSLITCVFSACGDNETNGESGADLSSSSSDEVSENSAESSSESDYEVSTDENGNNMAVSSSEDDTDISTELDDESSGEEIVNQEPVPITPGEAGDKNLIGAWTNDELSASYSSIKFTEDGIISTVIDCSEIMNISGDYLNMSGTECPYDFDGTKFTCIVTAADMGIEDSETEIEELSILEMTKLDPGDMSDLNGDYLLDGGMLYDAYSASLPMDGDIYITVNDGHIDMEIQICGYDSDGENLTWKGDAEALFGITTGENAVSTYTIDGDTLTLKSESSEEVLTRNIN